MNSDIQFVFMTLRLEAYDEIHKFTKEQRDELVAIINNVSDLEINPRKPFSFIKNFKKVQNALKDYEKTFASFGGDAEVLENKLKEIRTNKLKAAADVFKGK